MTELDDNTQSHGVSLDDPTQNTLDHDDMIDVDYTAKESGFGPYTPQVQPGVHTFLFALEDDKPFETREYTPKTGQDAGKLVKEFTVNHKGTISITDKDGQPKDVTIRFNQAGFRRTAKMKEKKMNSRGGELLRSLGIGPEKSTNQAAVEQALREADGRTMARGVVNWEAYCKDDKQTVSTNANTKRGDARWPKENGHYVSEVACPKCGQALNGREKITDYRLPQE